MYTVKFMTAGGDAFTTSIKPGTSIMEAAVAHDVPGIEAQCYGAGVCGTCHVYAATDALDRLPAKSAWEAEMLDNLPLARPNSRLSCQIRFETGFDGAEFEVPERQDTLG